MWPTNDGLTCIVAGWNDRFSDPKAPGYFRSAWGPGWVLVGDSAYHRHPLTAQEITDAFRDADLLSESLDEGFSGRRRLDDALADYARRRDAALMPMYERAA
jgi:2-polyprenyl-6-methoxyphenol hydroxylase-like FAD-dependent oxidoreductase